MQTTHDGVCDISVQEAAFDPKAIERIDAHYTSLVDSGRIQAAGWLLARSGKIFSHRTIGKLTYKKDSAPFKPDSIKNITSISKVFTASAIMKLVERGIIWLEQPVKTIIPEFDTVMHSPINIKHLLTHTSGLPADGGYFNEPYPLNRLHRLSST
jgi:CubicO group peptidase (beta-lactamase class C family)